MNEMLRRLLLGILLSTGAGAEDFGEGYPVPGRKADTTAFGHEQKAEHQASSSYPEWFRGKAANGKADEFSKYFFTQLVGRTTRVTSGLSADSLQMGTLVLGPGATYPAHNHPAREIYYVIEGEGDWYVDDERQHVIPGSVIMHRPYAVHGWTNTSKVKALKVIWIWWAEPGDPAGVLDKGARLVNPDLAAQQSTAKPFAVPLPTLQK